MQPCCHIKLFGGLQIQRNGQSITDFPKRKMAVLVAWLALAPYKPHSREVLAEMLWPDEDPEPVQDRFRHALQDLRQVLEPEGILRGSILIADRTNVQLNPDAVAVDVCAFELALRASARADDPELCLVSLLEALESYRGEFLPGFYDDWVLRERDRLASRYRGALSEAADKLAQSGRVSQAIDLASRAVEAEPSEEDGYALLMRLHARAGRPGEVERQFRNLERTLKEELDQSPSLPLQRLYEQLIKSESISGPPFDPTIATAQAVKRFEPTGGAVPLDSNLYLVRPVDNEMSAAITHRDSIVLLKGSRQTGKTSLLSRGLQQTRNSGFRTFVTDMQKFTMAQMSSAESLFRAIADSMIDELALEIDLDAIWKSGYSWNVNFERFLRKNVLQNQECHLVWALDEVDRLFGFDYSTEIFGLFRSWHNERSLNPDGAWSRLTLCIAYATEVHLFIRDLNQSPFNVGTRLVLDDFSPQQVDEMNRRYGSPLHTASELSGFFDLVGGNPYLVRRGLEALATDKMSLSDLESNIEESSHPFGEPLRRMVMAIRTDPELIEAAMAMLADQPCPNMDSFYRLKSAGIIIGSSSSRAKFRSELYRTFLQRHLRDS